MRRLITCLLPLFLVIGCKKEVEPVDSYLRMTIDGRGLDYSRNVQASRPDALSKYLRISGFCIHPDFGSFGIEMSNAVLGESRIVINSYTLLFTLYGIDNTNYYAGDGGFSGIAIGSGRITILELSNEYVRGTFDFITGPDAITKVKKTVLNGEFHIKRE